MKPRAAIAVIAVALAGACKVPLVPIDASFSLADAAYFPGERTLFFFYRVSAQQGIQQESQIELSWATDSDEQPWTAVSAIPWVHTHLPVDCGANGRCGSVSIQIDQTPRWVKARLRYHPQGSLALDAPLRFNVVGDGPPHLSRSLVVYGVFDETNTRVQWRARHQFPTLRNQEVEALGLRRYFRVEAPGFGAPAWSIADNPYGYGFAPECPAAFTPLSWEKLETLDRARFASEALPLAATTAEAVCAQSVVTDARGEFAAVAVARKNPQVRPAFPALHSPVHEAVNVGFVLAPCQREISSVHLAMQRQRLQLQDVELTCIDDFLDPAFANRLASILRARIDTARMQGSDMVLTLALHHDDATGRLARSVEQALQTVLSVERDKSSPRVSGATVLDSIGHTIESPALTRLVVWCPANLPDDLSILLDQTPRACATLPDVTLMLGPFRVGTLPILPTRAQYLNFLSKFSDAQAGRTKTLTFLTPQRTPISDNVELGEFGVATFFNNESFAAAPADAFSFCADDFTAPAVFRAAGSPPMSLAELPLFHQQMPQSAYQLGLAWDFPFLTRLEYEVTLAGAVTAFSLTVPFGVSSTSQMYFGAEQWQKSDFALADALAQCTLFCDHPTFDSAGVYNVNALFREAYANQCYRPVFPALDSGGYPLDP